MLHFPSPVKLTGWNATGGLLGRKDERFFFFSSPALLFFIPLPHHLFLTHTSAPSCLFVLFSCLLYVCFYVIGFLCNAASLSLMCWYFALACPDCVDPWTLHQCLLTAIQPCGHLCGHVTQQPSTISLLQCPRCNLLHELCATSNSRR